MIPFSFRIFLIGVLCSCSLSPVCADVLYLDTAYLPKTEQFKTDFDYLRLNRAYVRHWSPNWTFPVERRELIARLLMMHAGYGAISPKNTEMELFLGDIAHYLYNLKQDAYGDSAVMHYKAALLSDPADYRIYWFWGSHQAQSTQTDASVASFLQAEKMEPQQKPADFWLACTEAVTYAGMRAHARYALIQASAAKGQDTAEDAGILQDLIERNQRTAKRDSSYTNGELWGRISGNPPVYLSRALGIKLVLDSAWVLSCSGYEKGHADAQIFPSKLLGKSGVLHEYHINLLMKVASDTDKLEAFVTDLLALSPPAERRFFSKKYAGVKAYEMRDSLASSAGKASHKWMVVFERNIPPYPGLALEAPSSLPGKEGELNYYRLNNELERFPNRLFYAFLFDSPEDSYVPAFRAFKQLLEQQLTLD